ncbi:hypothetical protein Taro_026759 [Colocasia esculenta]|uniref:Uncharacterized protein n=1 Tax=Colocasia esculenta TaxID=4460 RepID=A0A843VI29_COLES|nr:hypothetical protein [Colocasia esculenta]
MPLKDYTFFSVPLFEFIAYLTGLNSNPSGSSYLWVVVRPSGSLAGVREDRWLAFQQGPSVSCRRVSLLLLGARAASMVASSLVLRLDFFFGLRVRVGVLRRLREPTCGVAFTGAGLCCLRNWSKNGALVVLVEVLPKPVCVASAGCCVSSVGHVFWPFAWVVL